MSLTENCSGNEFAYSGRNNYSFLNDSLFTSRLYINTNSITTNARNIRDEMKRVFKIVFFCDVVEDPRILDRPGFFPACGGILKYLLHLEIGSVQL